MVKLTDPITDQDYDPIGDPAGTLLQSVYVVGGIAMTLILFNIAQSDVVPAVSNLLSSLTGGAVADEGGSQIVTFGE